MTGVSPPTKAIGFRLVKYLLIVLPVWILSGCATLSVEQQAELDAMTEVNLQAMIEANPGLDKKLEECKGYMTLEAHVVKIPFIGWGGGKGIVVDKTNGQRTYVKASRLDVGGGGGIRKFDVLVVIYDEKLLRYATTGKRIFGAGAEASVGASSVEGSSDQVQTNKPYELFIRSDSGASVTWTVHTIRIKPYKT